MDSNNVKYTLFGIIAILAVVVFYQQYQLSIATSTIEILAKNVPKLQKK
tara:strand:+ start:581 stop:727 length:147 start_codon:yes stop_codon:yes gene_type:complete